MSTAGRGGVVSVPTLPHVDTETRGGDGVGNHDAAEQPRLIVDSILIYWAHE